jgi:hypothetical protein
LQVLNILNDLCGWDQNNLRLRRRAYKKIEFARI